MTSTCEISREKQAEKGSGLSESGKFGKEFFMKHENHRNRVVIAVYEKRMKNIQKE